MPARSDAYWRKRADLRMAEYHKASDKTIGTINRAYDKAVSDLNADIDRMFGKFVRDGNLTPDEARILLNTPVSQAEINNLRALVGTVKDPKTRRRLLNRLNARAYSARITRLEALKEDAYIRMKQVADVELSASTAAYTGTAKDAYLRSMFDLQQGTGFGFEVAAISDDRVREMLRQNWSGKHFSARIWDNTDEVAEQLQDILTSGLTSGKSYRRMTEELMEATRVGKFAASRLIRTESTYIANAAEMETYKDCDVTRYMYLATLDLRTSETCQKHDRKIYPVSTAEAGKNLPPLHPFCRSTTRAYFEDMTFMKRRARNPATGEPMTVPPDTTYKQWKDKYISKSSGKVTERKPVTPKQTEPKPKVRPAIPEVPAEQLKPVTAKRLGAMTMEELRERTRKLALQYYPVSGISFGGESIDKVVETMMSQKRSRTSLIKDYKAMEKKLLKRK